MKIKVVAWNMKSNPENWDFLRQQENLADATISLLCEATSVPEGVNAVGHGSTKGIDCVCGGPDCDKRTFSTAVAALHPLEEMPKDTRVDRYYGKPLPFEPSRPGTWTARRVDLGDLKITAIALYGFMDEKSDASLHRSLSELSPVFDHEEYGKYLILGGDLNILPKPRRADRLNRGQVLMERIRAYGLIDCLEERLASDRYEDPVRRAEMDNCQCGLREKCTHTRTFVDKELPDIPYQDDYLFASKALAKRLETCSALPSMPEWPPDWPSDHAAIVAEFNI